MNNTYSLQTLGPTDKKAYMAAAVFIGGNMLLPQLCHLIPMGGKIFLPIFFFTLVGAYRYGIMVGIATAVLSPIANSMVFGLPSEAMLPPMLLQSMLLATAASLTARLTGRATAGLLAIVATACQMSGLIIEKLMMDTDSSIAAAFGMAVPGILLQVFGGLYLIRKL